MEEPGVAYKNIPVSMQAKEHKSPEFLVTKCFTITDLTITSIIMITGMIAYDMSAYTNIGSWLGRVTSREAVKKLQTVFLFIQLSMRPDVDKNN